MNTRRAEALPAMATGAAAVVFSTIYFASDVLELVDGGFSTVQLLMTYASEAAIPLFVIGLCAFQRPRLSVLGQVAAVVYAYTFVFFTSTVIYALIDHTSDWTQLQDRFGPWILTHSVLMVIAGTGFGWAVARAGVLPRWTGLALVAGMVLMAATSSLPAPLATISAGVRDVAFAAMGVAVLRATISTPDAPQNRPTVVGAGVVQAEPRSPAIG